MRWTWTSRPSFQIFIIHLHWSSILWQNKTQFQDYVYKWWFCFTKINRFFFMEHGVFDNNGNLFKRRCIKYEEVVKARQKVYRFLVMLQVLRRKENGSNKVVLLKKKCITTSIYAFSSEEKCTLNRWLLGRSTLLYL